MPRRPLASLATALDEVWRLALALSPLAVLAPLFLQHAFERLRPSRPSRLFELAGVSVATAAVLAAAWVARRRRLRGAALVPVGGWLLVVCMSLQLLGPAPSISWDFQAYERAADAMRADTTPYPAVNPYYTYPPALARAMGAITTAIEAGLGETRAAAWADLFYLCQLLQIGLLSGAYVMLYRFAVQLGLDSVPAAIVVASLLIVNTGIGLTIALSQVNVLILVLALTAIGRAGRRDALAGLALACAAVIKLYPFMLFPAWIMAGQRRVVAWATAWTGVIVAVTLPWKWWIEFVRLWLRPAAYPTAGDNTIYNVFANGARFLGLTSPDAPPPVLRWLWIASVLGIAAWAVSRFRARLEVQRRSSGTSRLAGADLFACTAEVMALTLFVSPLVWVHHFVFALPIAVLAAATAPPERRDLVGAGAILMLAMPWSDLFLVGYHRLFGLGLILYACRPAIEPRSRAAMV